MTISGRQKHGLENWIRDLIQAAMDFGKERADMSKEMYNSHTSLRATDIANNILYLILDIPENHGSMGQIRGYIRRVRRGLPLTEMSEPHSDAYNAVQNILSATKLVMNGENVLSPPICKYVDRTEVDADGKPFVCMKIIGYGFDYCYDHWIIVREIKKNGEKDEQSTDN